MRPAQMQKFLEFAIPNKFTILVKGKPGIGKTDIIKKVVAACGYDLLISHPVVSDPTDYKGLPFANNGVADFLPYGDLRRLIEADRPLVCFFDDLGQAPVAVQAALMQLLLARHIGNHAVSPWVIFIAATNDKKDNAGVTGLLNPVKSRFTSIVELEVNAEDWRKWALGAGMPAELVAFLAFRPNLLESAATSKDLVNTVSPRTLSSLGRLQLAGVPDDLEFDAFSGATGEGFAVEYRNFKKLIGELPSLDDIIARPMHIAVSKDPATQYALASAIGAGMTKDNIEPLMQFVRRLPKEIGVVCIYTAYERTLEIRTTQAFTEWARDNAHLM